MKWSFFKGKILQDKVKLLMGNLPVTRYALCDGRQVRNPALTGIAEV